VTRATSLQRSARAKCRPVSITLTVCPGVRSSSLKWVVGMGHVPSGPGLQAPPTHCVEAQGHWLSLSGGHTCGDVSAIPSHDRKGRLLSAVAQPVLAAASNW